MRLQDEDVRKEEDFRYLELTVHKRLVGVRWRDEMVIVNRWRMVCREF